MKQIGSYEAKVHWSRLLDEVAKGEVITITKHGVPVAELRPANGARRRKAEDVVEAFQRFAEKNTLGGISIKELIEEGRRF